MVSWFKTDVQNGTYYCYVSCATNIIKEGGMDSKTGAQVLTPIGLPNKGRTIKQFVVHKTFN